MTKGKAKSNSKPISGQREEIKKSLVDSLTENGKATPYNLSLVDDYMGIWDDDRILRNDIIKRGRKVTKLDSRGQRQKVNNDSIDQLLKNSSQKLQILKMLGIKNGVDDPLLPGCVDDGP